MALIWFALLAGTGIYNITFFPGIMRAFDPSRAVLRMCVFVRVVLRLMDTTSVFVRTKNYDSLTGVLLAVTGCEAIFAK